MSRPTNSQVEIALRVWGDDGADRAKPQMVGSVLEGCKGALQDSKKIC